MWAPLGPDALFRFADSYRRHPANDDHSLLVVFKGFSARQDLRPWRESLLGISYEELRMEANCVDLGTYRDVIEEVEASWYCFVNSESVVLADGWLATIARHLRDPDIGLVGTSASYESARTSAPPWLRPRRYGFESFPNPHIRTNGFAVRRDIARSLAWPRARTKMEAWKLESGRRSLTRQVLARGYQVVVVGRDGVAYPPERWRESATFRSGQQANAWFGDNRTREWESASPARQATLERMAWGTGALSSISDEPPRSSDRSREARDHEDR